MTNAIATYTTRAGKNTHILSLSDAPVGQRAPACGQRRAIRGSGYMRFSDMGAPTCPACAAIAAERIAENGSAERFGLTK